MPRLAHPKGERLDERPMLLRYQYAVAVRPTYEKDIYPCAQAFPLSQVVPVQSPLASALLFFCTIKSGSMTFSSAVLFLNKL